MKRVALCALLLVAFAACPAKKRAESPDNLLSHVKQGLADRDGKLVSYQLAGATRQQGQEAAFEFFYRFPNQMRGVLTQPLKKAFSFDGKSLYELSTDERRFTRFELKLTPQKSLMLLTQTFAPFAPEGYRAPLLLNEGVTATRGSHPKAPEAVELRVATRDEAGQPMSVVYVLRWPTLDFLAKKTELGGRTIEVRVDTEHCEEKLKMCFPKQLSQWEGKDLIASTHLATISLNAPITQESFTLTAPEGFESLQRELVGAGD
jgi:outer membrane lipoprotein-sorting protein